MHGALTFTHVFGGFSNNITETNNELNTDTQTQNSYEKITNIQ